MSNELSYFKAATFLTNALSIILELIGQKITERGLIYHRGAFYADCAAAIRKLLELGMQPFVASAYNWEWWAGEMEKRATELGSDAQYAVKLNDPLVPGLPRNYSVVTSLVDSYVRFLFGSGGSPGIYGQEEIDADVTDLGNITPAECVKITHRVVYYRLAGRYGQYKPLSEITPWITAVADELKSIYRAMGEPDKAGSAWDTTPGQPVPPISWPNP